MTALEINHLVRAFLLCFIVVYLHQRVRHYCALYQLFSE